jgi:transcriptional regulator with XRE-family HTH domain
MSTTPSHRDLPFSNLRYWKEYGHRLLVTRLTLGMTETEAAAAYGVQVRTYKRWEAGHPQREGIAALQALAAFSKVYKVSLAWIIAGEGFNLEPHLAVNPGSKLAILPINSAARQRALAETAREVAS